MNLPNYLTLSRFVFAILIAAFLLMNSLAGNIAAMVLFIAASATDFYDGYFAKKLKLVSNFGKIMDPIADKALMLIVFTTLAHLGMVGWWMVIVIAIREVTVTASRLKAMSKGKVLAAEQAGKIKTVFQIVSVVVILLFLIFEQNPFVSKWFYQVEVGWRALINVLMVISVLLTLYSGIAYFRSKWKNDQTFSF